MQLVTLRPLNGLLVRNPKTLQPLPVEGETVELDSYWTRRLIAREVEEVNTPQPEGGQ